MITLIWRAACTGTVLSGHANESYSMSIRVIKFKYVEHNHIQLSCKGKKECKFSTASHFFKAKLGLEFARLKACRLPGNLSILLTLHY